MGKFSAMNTDPSELIRNAKFFSGLSEAACDKLARMSHRKTIAKRELLFMEGTEGNAVYLLTSGSLQLVKTNLDGKETVIKTVKIGELFAEVILFEKSKFPVTAVACTDAEVIELPRTGFLKLLNEEEFRNDFMAMLMAKQRYLAERIRQLTSMDVEGRFVEFLREHYGEKEKITPNLSKKDIASAIGATPETFSRLLQKLEKRADFSWEGKTLSIKPSFWEEF
jgi:CRP/FNR family transcriptional regulator